MSELIKVRIENSPECWESCGTCAAEELVIAEVRVCVGQRVGLYETLLVWEAAKTEVELCSPCAGTVAALLVAEGDAVEAGEPLLLIDPGHA